MKKFITFLLSVVLAAVLLYGMSYSAERPIGIGIVYDNENTINKELKDIFMSEIEKLMGKENVRLVEEVSDGNTVEGIKTALRKLDNNQDIDFIITLGVLSSHVADREDNYKKKIIAPFMYSKATTESGIASNVTVIAADYGIEDDIKFFMDTTGVKKINIVVEKEFGKDYFAEIDDLEKYMKEKNIKYNMVELREPIENTFENMKSGDGVFFGLVKEFSDNEMKTINKVLSEKQIPSYSIMGRMEVIRGMSMGADYSKDVSKFARKTGVIISRIHDGEQVGRRENIVIEHKKYFINADFAGDRLNSNSITNVEIAGESTKRKRTVGELISAGYRNNLKLDIKKKEQSIQKEEKAGADAKLLPKLKADLSGVVLDKNTVIDNKGMAREKTVSGKLTLTQVIFSEKANMNKDVQKKILEIKDAEIEKQKQDMKAEIMITYLNYKKAEANLEIQRNLLATNMENLDIAKNKQKIGAINTADVYRWESETAIARTSVKKAEDMVKQIKERIIKTTGIEKEEEMYFEDAENIYKYLADYNDEIKEKIDSLDSGYIEKRYSEKALKNSIELGMLDKNREINERVLKSSERSRYIPTVALQSSFTKKLYKGGTGEHMMMEPASDNNWNIGVGVSLDIYDAGEKSAEIRKNRLETEKTNSQKSDAESDIREAVKDETDNLITGYISAKNMNEALKALEKNHMLVSDAYNNGMVDMSVLLSSRNALVQAEQGEAVAKYDYMISLVKLERLAGNLGD